MSTTETTTTPVQLDFNKQQLYAREIEPVRDALFDLCQKHGLPMFCAIQTSSDEDNATIETCAVRKGLNAAPVVLATAKMAELIQEESQGDPASTFWLSQCPIYAAAKAAYREHRERHTAKEPEPAQG